MGKDDGSRSKASSKPKVKKAREKKGNSGLSTLSLDAPSAGAVTGSDTSGGANPPTSASELKALLRKSLDEEAKRARDGVANAAPNAESESPLLVRADTATPRASPEKPKEAKRKNSEKKTKKNRKESTKEPRSPPMQNRLSTTSTPRDNNNNNSSEVSSQIGNARISGPRLNLSFGSCFGNNRSLVSFMPWGAERLILAMGTLRTPPSVQSPPPTLSFAAQAQVEALAPIVKKCWIELFVERSDELPFGVYSKPQVQVHLVDRFTGKPIPPMAMTSHAKLNYSCSYANAFKWYQSLRFPITLVEFLSPHSLLLFEIFEIPTPTEKKKKTKHVRTKQHNGVRFEQVREEEGDQNTRSEPGGGRQQPRRRIAWAFYSPVSEKGNVMLRTLSPLDDSDLQQQHDTENGGGDGGGAQAENGSIHLQLYEYQIMTWMDQFQAKSQWQWTSPGSSNAPATNASATTNVPAIYLQYQKRRRAVVPSTIYVEIRPIIPPMAVVGENTTAAISVASNSQTLAQEDNNAEPVDNHHPDDETKNGPPDVDTSLELQQTTTASPSTSTVPS